MINTRHDSHIDNSSNRIPDDYFDLDSFYKQYRKKINTEEFSFELKHEAFPNGYSYDDFNQYFGFLVVPYSSFSMLGLELYEYNLPYFYPSPKLLLKNNPQDHILYPTYCSKNEYQKMENDIEDQHSPNNYSQAARSRWLNYFSGYQSKNTIIYNDFTDLFDKILWAKNNFKKISKNMYEENQAEKKELLNRWKVVFDQKSLKN